jgi:hypothetical protein
MSPRTALLSCLLTVLCAGRGVTQQSAPLRPDGNGIAALQHPVGVSLQGIALSEAVQRLASEVGVQVSFGAALPELGRRVSLRADSLSAAAALLRLLAGTGLEARVVGGDRLAIERLPTATLAELVITPGRFGVERDAVAAAVSLSREDMETAPQLGEDVFRMMNRLPGVAASDVSARFAVRGGANEELLVLLDGLELVEPFHVKDFDGAISIVDAEALGGVALTTGGFTAEHGDRLTGVFEMRTAAPPPGRPVTEVGLSLSNTRFLSRGAFAGTKGQWLLSARRGYLDVLLKLIHEQNDVQPRYGDALAKLQYQLGAHHVVAIHGLYAGDRLRYRDRDFVARSGYENAYGWLTWDARYGARLGARSVASLGDLSWDRRGEREGVDPDVQVTDVRGYRFAALKQEWSWEATDRLVAKWGWELKGLDARYDYTSQHLTRFFADGRLQSATDTISIRKDPSGHAAGAYLSARVRPVEPLTLEAGLRYDEHSYSGDRVWSPRLNLSYALGSRTTLRAAWGLFHQSQGIQELQVQDGVEEFQGGERAEHRIVSIEQQLGTTSLRVEAYQRRLDPVRLRFGNLQRFIEPFPEVENDRVLLRSEGGDARGVELFAEGARGARVRWSASYALARIQDRYAGGTAPRALDQRHTVQLGGSYVPSPRWRASVAWQYHSGWPNTARIFRLDTLADGRRIILGSYGPYFGDRLPPYHRLDARITRNWTLGRGRLAAFLDAYNAYNRANPHGYDYDASLRPDGTLAVSRISDSLLPFLPSLGLSWEF